MSTQQHHGDYIVSGTPVRLSFDTGAKSVGAVREVIDPVRLRLEFPSENGSNDGEWVDGPVAVFVMPRSVVVPVCEWVDRSLAMPCHYDATTTVRPGGAPMNLCREHATESLREALTSTR